MHCGMCNFFRKLLTVAFGVAGIWQLVLAYNSAILSMVFPHLWGAGICFGISVVIFVFGYLDKITENDDSVDYGNHVYPNREMKKP